MSKEQNSCPQVTILQLTKLIIKEIRTMKKVLYFMGFLLAMASCESKDDAGIWADPLGYDQEDAKTVELAVAEAPAIDYATIEDVENATVQLFIPTIVAADEATATYEAVLYNSDKTKSETIDAGTDGTVKAADLQSAMISLYGNNGDTHTVPVDVNAAALVAGLGMNLTGSTTATVTLVAPEYPEYIYVPGNDQGVGSWSPETAAALYSPNVDGIYTGYAYIDGDFKFTKARNWDAEYNWTDFNTVPSFMTQGGGTNINSSEGGLFYMVVNVAAGSIEATKIDNMNLVGAFNGWNPADDTQQMTWNKDELCFVKTGAAVASDGWKFTANNGWDINLGGTIDNLVANGDNLSVVGTTIKLYPCRTTSDKIFATVE